jgi:hypothetical protein
MGNNPLESGICSPNRRPGSFLNNQPGFSPDLSEYQQRIVYKKSQKNFLFDRIEYRNRKKLFNIFNLSGISSILNALKSINSQAVFSKAIKSHLLPCCKESFKEVISLHLEGPLCNQFYDGELKIQYCIFIIINVNSTNSTT